MTREELRAAIIAHARERLDAVRAAIAAMPADASIDEKQETAIDLLMDDLWIVLVAGISESIADDEMPRIPIDFQLDTMTGAALDVLKVALGFKPFHMPAHVWREAVESGAVRPIGGAT